MTRVGVLQPLRHRDFALLWAGLSVSLLGDGIYFVAIAWQVYELTDAPTALGVVGVAWTLPLVLLVLGGGVLSDRMDRRLLMVAADALRFVAITAIAALALSGAIELWHLLALVALYGCGDALFNPAATALTPMLVPRDELVRANALEGLMRPLAMKFAGPALGGAIVAAGGAGAGFAVDAATFLVSGAFVLAIRTRARAAPAEPDAPRSALAELREGLRFVRSKPWLWATLCSVSIALFAFFGPRQVLLPLRLKEELGFGAGTFGAVLAAAGAGSVTAAIAVGQLGIPRRFVTWLYVAWAVATFEIAVFGIASLPWQFMLAALVGGALETFGNVIWATLLAQRVPGSLLGRVSSVDWQISVLMVPLSFAVTGPLAEAVGTRETMLGAGLLGGAAGLAFLFVPGVRAPERER